MIMKMFLNMAVLVLTLMPLAAMAQFNKASGDLVFTTNGNEVARVTTTGVLEVERSIKVKNDTGTCNSAKEGTIRFSTPKVSICNGSSWVTLSTD